MSESCGHDGWVKGCPFCEANERAALARMPGERAEHVCSLCEQPCDERRDFVVGLDGSAQHVSCLEDSGQWNQRPEELRDNRD